MNYKFDEGTKTLHEYKTVLSLEDSKEFLKMIKEYEAMSLTNLNPPFDPEDYEPEDDFDDDEWGYDDDDFSVDPDDLEWDEGISYGRFDDAK